MPQAIKKYQKKAQYSYTLGAFVTFELLHTHPERVLAVYLHSAIDSPEMERDLRALCREKGINCTVNDRIVEKLREKENCYVIGVFSKYEETLDPRSRHIVLVSPSDMGNVGTILRTGAGFGFRDLALIQPAADVFNPKTIRASMGALFRMRVRYYADFDEYLRGCGERTLYPFVLHGKHVLQELPRAEGAYSLIFGNEATGLPRSFRDIGESVTIRHGDVIDSLNLSMAAGIAFYEFTRWDSLHSKENCL